RIDPERLHQAARFGAVRKRRLDARRSAVGQPEAPARTELVALRVSAEVVVVVEDEDAGARPLHPVEVRRREAADAAADDDQIEALAGVDRRAGAGPEPAVAKRVRRLERPGMTAAHP